MKKETIVFVHGAWHGKWCWEHFEKYFETEGFNCHSFNLPKHDKFYGRWTMNKLTLANYVQALADEIQSLDVEPILIGHSMGGLVVQKYLQQNNCKLAILLASVPVSGVWGATFRFIKKYRTLALHKMLTFNLYGLVDSKEQVRWAFFSDTFPDTELEKYRPLLCGESYWAFSDMLVFKFQNKKTKFQIPTLVLAAENDTIFSIEENKKTAEVYAADFYLVKDIAHDMMLDVGKEIVMEKINSWIQKKL